MYKPPEAAVVIRGGQPSSDSEFDKYLGGVIDALKDLHQVEGGDDADNMDSDLDASVEDADVEDASVEDADVEDASVEDTDQDEENPFGVVRRKKPKTPSDDENPFGIIRE